MRGREGWRKGERERGREGDGETGWGEEERECFGHFHTLPHTRARRFYPEYPYFTPSASTMSCGTPPPTRASNTSTIRWATLQRCDESWMPSMVDSTAAMWESAERQSSRSPLCSASTRRGQLLSVNEVWVVCIARVIAAATADTRAAVKREVWCEMQGRRAANTIGTKATGH